MQLKKPFTKINKWTDSLFSNTHSNIVTWTLSPGFFRISKIEAEVFILLICYKKIMKFYDIVLNIKHHVKCDFYKLFSHKLSLK